MIAIKILACFLVVCGCNGYTVPNSGWKPYNLVNLLMASANATVNTANSTANVTNTVQDILEVVTTTEIPTTSVEEISTTRELLEVTPTITNIQNVSEVILTTVVSTTSIDVVNTTRVLLDLTSTTLTAVVPTTTTAATETTILPTTVITKIETTAVPINLTTTVLVNTTTESTTSMAIDLPVTTTVRNVLNYTLPIETVAELTTVVYASPNTTVDTAVPMTATDELVKTTNSISLNSTTANVYDHYYNLFTDYLVNVSKTQFNCTGDLRGLQCNFLNETKSIQVNNTDLKTLLTPVASVVNSTSDVAPQNVETDADDYIRQFIDTYRYNYCRIFYDGIFCKEFFINYDDNSNSIDQVADVDTVEKDDDDEDDD